MHIIILGIGLNPTIDMYYQISKSNNGDLDERKSTSGFVFLLNSGVIS